MERLKADSGLYEQTLIVFLSDHGEEFSDHGSWQHAKTLYQELVHVPWVLKAPGGSPSGVRVSDVVRQVDLLPTVLDFAGTALPSGLEGTSVRPLLDAAEMPAKAGAGEPPRPALASLDAGGLVVRSIESGRFKLVLHEAFDRPHRRIELYDLPSDPDERNDVSRQQPVWTGYLRAELLRSLRSTATAAAEQIEIDAEERRALEALGYID